MCGMCVVCECSEMYYLTFYVCNSSCMPDAFVEYECDDECVDDDICTDTLFVNTLTSIYCIDRSVQNTEKVGKYQIYAQSVRNWSYFERGKYTKHLNG